MKYVHKNLCWTVTSRKKILMWNFSIDFDRFCFYGCYCLPDAAIHDSSPGVGQPVDAIDNSCKELKQCYQCANRDTQEDKGNLSLNGTIEPFTNDSINAHDRIFPSRDHLPPRTVYFTTLIISGDECHQDAAYSVNPLTDSSGKIYDYQCTNREDSCRWRICQCDRAFAHKIKAEVK